ncbi:hypothetical protein RO950_02540 [Staphylococcus haemolyticus]|uniref:Uncharacterized protein n=2 Tax=Staphylococcus haemolyticus TaxID=1283 RepID=A0ABU3IEB0_STAHA|nr:hypothetical protein [Staphylococcus haemolyticus]AUV66353.1 hypothetical protein CUZ62_00995 [Staphylococcus haemolyticus]AUV68736.1 hypothetical protein CYD28_00995 [Staphylococcus haemolyticus]MBF2286294.1 hypothetical protein [Staphylococcus haemolyticus]MBF2300154.1 hypothetical protein [Staphylococcus haemolyticus]MDT4241799.1 hypothetical protein [Staphylococcus haemolyticus]
MKLKLTDKEVIRLIELSKKVLMHYNIKVEDVGNGEIEINSNEGTERFILSYFIKPGKITINYRETIYNLSLVRLNLNNGFHKNANNERVFGNRINIYSEKEFEKKGDGSTYMIAHPLPYKSFEDTSDFVQQLYAMLKYTNTKYDDKIIIDEYIFDKEG